MQYESEMTRFCPICGTRNEAAALGCHCGRVFTDEIKESQYAPEQSLANSPESRLGRVLSNEIKASQSPSWIDPRSYRRRRIIKKAGVLLGSVTTVLFFAAYFGGFFPMQGQADIEEESESPLAEARPVAAQPAAGSPVFPGGNVPPQRIFPESNVSYKATKAITGSVIAVADADGQERRVTLFGIRVPKLDENFGVESKEKLWIQIANKPLLIKRLKYTKEVDTIAEVSIEGSNVGLEQLRSGMALLAPEDVAGLPSADQQQYLAAAHSAKQGKYGMWSGKTPTSPQSAPPDPTLRSSDPLPAGIKKPGQRKQTAGTSFDLPDFVYESAPRVVPLVSEPAAKPKEQEPPAVLPPSETAPREPAKVVTTPSSTGRKYVRGPFGGCYYINSSGNKSYVDRSKCE